MKSAFLDLFGNKAVRILFAGTVTGDGFSPFRYLLTNCCDYGIDGPLDVMRRLNITLWEPIIIDNYQCICNGIAYSRPWLILSYHLLQIYRMRKAT